MLIYIDKIREVCYSNSVIVASYSTMSIPKGTLGFCYDEYALYGHEVYLNTCGELVDVTERRSSDELPGMGKCVGELVRYVRTVPGPAETRDLYPLPFD